MMLRALGASVVLAVALHVVVGAQQISEGRNVMPVWMPCDPNGGTPEQQMACRSDSRWATAWKYGDIFLQRQVECSLAPSTVNANHLLAGCIDYSSVELPADNPPTVGSTGLSRFVGLLARMVRRPREPAPLPKAYAGSEAW